MAKSPLLCHLSAPLVDAWGSPMTAIGAQQKLALELRCFRFCPLTATPARAGRRVESRRLTSAFAMSAMHQNRHPPASVELLKRTPYGPLVRMLSASADIVSAQIAARQRSRSLRHGTRQEEARQEKLAIFSVP
jgi:hypothetical protein